MGKCVRMLCPVCNRSRPHRLDKYRLAWSHLFFKGIHQIPLASLATNMVYLLFHLFEKKWKRLEFQPFIILFLIFCLLEYFFSMGMRLEICSLLMTSTPYSGSDWHKLDWFFPYKQSTWGNSLQQNDWRRLLVRWWLQLINLSFCRRWR